MAAKKITKKLANKTKRASKPSKVSTTASKIAKKSPKQKATKRRIAAAEVLSAEERAKLLKPRTDFLEVLGRVTREWDEYRALRVPGITLSKLTSLGKAATRATEKERALQESIVRKLVPIADARRVAHDAAYRALLDTHAAIKLHARLDPGVIERFGFLSDLVRNQPSAEEPVTPPIV